MPYEIFAGTGLYPFVPDPKRGYWSQPNDFIYAGIALVFRMDIFPMSVIFSSMFDEFALTPTYLLTLALYVVPIMIMQSFLGQFSSSGYISAFRLAPLFKGIGYITLFLNLCVIMYYSIFAVIPLAYFFASMQPILPWSCEGFKIWATNLTEEEKFNLCNMKPRNKLINASEDYTEYPNTFHYIPSVLYFKNMFNGDTDTEFIMSWQLLLYSILVWILVTVIIYKFFETERMGQLIRYCIWICIGLLIVCLIRFSCLPGSGAVYNRFFIPQWRDLKHGITLIPIYGLSAFGPGWGIIILLSSFNKFKTDITRTSWIIGTVQMFVLMGLSLLTHLIDSYFKEITKNYYIFLIHGAEDFYLSSGSVMADMEWSNLWSLLFFFMMFLGAFLLIIIQLFSILITIFDEFPMLRKHKRKICVILAGALCLISLYFSSIHGITFYKTVSTDFLLTQNALNLLLIIIVLWIYGRVKFQRDTEFMLNKRIIYWEFDIFNYMISFFIFFALLIIAIVVFIQHVFLTRHSILILFVFVIFPWIFIPLYAFYVLCQSVGSIPVRFQNCCKPNDWYPVEAEDRQLYEATMMGNANLTSYPNEVDEQI